MSSTDPSHVHQEIADIESALNNPNLSQYVRQFLENQLNKLNRNVEKDTGSRDVNVKEGLGISSMSGGKVIIHFNRLPEEDQKRLTTWFDEWKKELSDRPLADGEKDISVELAQQLMECSALQSRAIRDFQGISHIIKTIEPDSLSDFYEALDNTFFLSKIRWIDVAKLQWILERIRISDELARIASKQSHQYINPPDKQQTVVYRLAQLTYENNDIYHPLCTFVYWVANLGDLDDRQKEELQKWLEEIKSKRDVSPDVGKAEQRSITVAYIVVAIKSAEPCSFSKLEQSFDTFGLLPKPLKLLKQVLKETSQKRFCIDVWVCDENGEIRYAKMSEPEEQYTADSLLDQVQKKIRQAIGHIGYQKDTPKIIVEFELEKDWLLCEMEHLPLAEMTSADLDSGIIPTPMGYDHPVIVRMHRQPLHVIQLKLKWQNWESKSCTLDSCDIASLSELAHSQNEYLRRQLDRSFATIMTFAPDDRSVYRRVLHYASERGILLALLPRPGITIAERVLADTLQQIIQTDSLEAVRESVMHQRREAQDRQDGIGYHLILFWNDPNRLHPQENARLDYKQR